VKKIPEFKDPEISKFMTEFMREFDSKDKEYLKLGTANRSLLLYSPSLKVFEIKVSDTGVITATKVSGT
jgi:hypothetical protein